LLAESVMLMELAVLGSATSWHLRDLQRAAADQHHVQPLPFTRLHAYMDGSQTEVFSRQCGLEQFDAILVRAMPTGSLEQVVFRMDALATHETVGGLVVNCARSLEVAIDKFLTLTRLQRTGFTVPKTYVCQDYRDASAAIEALGGSCVAKPIFGGEGRGVCRISWPQDQQRLRELARTSGIFFLQRFIPHEGRDFRLFVVGERVLGMQRVNPSDWRTNISLGAVGERLKITSELGGMAQSAAAAIGATVCAIDLLPAKDGRLFALEVNAVPGWRALADTTGEDVARLVLDHVESLLKKGTN
jgi:ribosomal protein S6--L-glutamate ligase